MSDELGPVMDESETTLVPEPSTGDKVKNAAGYLLAAITLTTGIMAIASLFVSLNAAQSDAISKALIVLLNIALVYFKPRLD